MPMSATLRMFAVNFGGCAVFAFAAWALDRASNQNFAGLGLLVAVLTLAWVGFAIADSVVLFSRSYDWTQSRFWGSGVALALPLIPVSLFWQSLSLLSRPQWIAAEVGVGFTIVWAMATYLLGVVVRAVWTGRDAPSWILFILWLLLCGFYGLQNTLSDDVVYILKIAR